MVTKKFNVLIWDKLAKIIYSGFIYNHKLKTLVYDAHFKRRLM